MAGLIRNAYEKSKRSAKGLLNDASNAGLNRHLFSLENTKNSIASNPATAYAKNNLAVPARQAFDDFSQVDDAFRSGGIKAAAIKAGGGALNAGTAAFNATPAGIANNTALGIGTAIAKSAREGGGAGQLIRNVGKYSTEPTSFATEGLGVKNPYAAFAVDLIAGNPRGSLGGVANLKNLSRDAGLIRNISTAGKSAAMVAGLSNPVTSVRQDLRDVVSGVHSVGQIPENAKDFKGLARATNTYRRPLAEGAETFVNGVPVSAPGGAADIASPIMHQVTPREAEKFLRRGKVDEPTFLTDRDAANVKIYVDPNTKRVVSWDTPDAAFAERIQRQASHGSIFQPQVGAVGDNIPKGPRSQIRNIAQEREMAFAKAARTSPALSPATQDLMKAEDITSDIRDTKKLGERASQEIDRIGLDAAKERAMNAEEITDEAVANAIEVAKRLDASGQHAASTEVLMSNARRARDAGRAAQANVLLERLTPTGIKAQIAAKAERLGKKVSDADYDRVSKMMEEALKQPEGRTRNLAVQKAQEAAARIFPSSILDQVISVWRAGLLTGGKTTGANLAANTGSTVMKKLSDVPSTAIDAALSLFTGERTKTLTMKGTLRGASEGVREGIDYFVHGYDASNVGNKFEGGTQFSNNALGNAAEKYTNVIHRFIGSQDRPFNKAAFFNSVADQAGAEAKNLKLKGPAYTKYVDDMLENPSAKIGKRAADEADQVTFANDTALGTGVSSLIKDVPGAKGVIPFVKTPTAVVGSVFSYTPVGPVYEIGKQINSGKFDQRALAQALGKGATGTAALWIGTELAKGGYVNTSYPKDEAERELWKAEGRMENSIMLPNGTQVSSNSLGPAGNLIIAGAAMQQAKENGGDPTSVLLSQVGNTALESPALQGISGVTDALKDPQRAGESYVTSTAGSAVPALVADLAQASDKAQNGQTVAREANSVGEAVKNRIPILRSQQNVAVDFLGRDRTTGKGTVQTLIDPLRSKDLRKDPLTDELSRLVAAGENPGISKLDATVKAFGQETKLDPDQLNAFTRDTGTQVKKRLEQVTADPSYARLGDAEKAKVLSDAVSDVRTAAKQGYVAGGGQDKAGVTVQGMSQGPTASKEDQKPSSPPAAKGKADYARPSSSDIDLARYSVRSGVEQRKELSDRWIIADDTAESGYREIKKSTLDSNRRSYDASVAKRDGDYKKWEPLEIENMNSLMQELDTLDPEFDFKRMEEIQNSLESKAESIAKYRSYGGKFKAPKRGKAPSVPRLSAPKRPSQSRVTIKNIRVKGA